MNITIKEKGQEKVINVNTWSVVKAVFIGSLIINLIALGGFLAIGILWTFLKI